MDKEVLLKSLGQTGNAVARLGEVLNAQGIDHDLLRDATIQRFEVAYEQMWKFFRKVHVKRGLSPNKVRRAFESFAEAGAAGWLHNRDCWEQMISDRNFTSHEYDEPSAETIYQRITQNYYPEMRAAFEHVKIHYFDKTPFDEWNDRTEKN